MGENDSFEQKLSVKSPKTFEKNIFGMNSRFLSGLKTGRTTGCFCIVQLSLCG
jgi:hypothetical protein